MTAAADRVQVAAVAEAIGSSLMPDSDQWTNRFTVQSSSSDTLYTVAQRHSDGTWGCSCWGWKRHRHCKHLVDILGRLAAAADALGPTADKVAPAAVAILRSARTAYLDLDESVRAPVESAPKVSRLLDW